MTTQLLPGCTGVLALADGTILQGIGVGATGTALGEVVFNTAMTGYQEILTDPSYMSQILAFTFPHVGNVGTNADDIEQMGGGSDTSARGAIFRDVPTDAANWRADSTFDAWMKRRGVVGLAGVDTRALTKIIRDKGAPNAVIAHDPDGRFDLEALVAEAKTWTGLVGLDLAKPASTLQSFEWDEGLWEWPEGHPRTVGRKSVVVIDYGVKRNILRALASTGAKITVVPATTSAEEILARAPDGVVLSNGPGDPAATGEYAVPEIRKLVESGKPIFGICLGHQMLALALGAHTIKMDQG
uniref:carbamoyl phosphate synthase small subunit n=1 Tax=Brevundimonas sp. TaxID=1871086 RepID=UPI0037843330